MQWLFDIIHELLPTWGYLTQDEIDAYLERPRFLVYRRDPITVIPSSTWTLLPFNSVDFDTHLAWDAPNYRYLNKMSGYYQVNFSGGLRPGIAAGERLLVSLRRAGVTVAFASEHAGCANYVGASGSIMLRLDGNQYFQVYIWHDHPTGLFLDYTQELNYLSVHGLI